MLKGFLYDVLQHVNKFRWSVHLVLPADNELTDPGDPGSSLRARVW